MEKQKVINSQTNPTKEQQTWGISLPDSKLYYKAIVSKKI